MIHGGSALWRTLGNGTLRENNASCGLLRSPPALALWELTMANLDPRPTLEAPDDDPYLWFEEIEGVRALAFVDAQNAATLKRFGDARFAADRDTLKAIFDRPDNIPYPNRRA